MDIILTNRRVYLAGPEVFLEKADLYFKEAQELCRIRGLVGVVPSDGGLSQGLTGTGAEISERIYQANIALIKGCDALVANLAPFRGKIEPDSGTAFEVGFACALGIPVAGYLPAMTTHYETKVKQHFGGHDKDGLPFDDEFGYLIESLEQPLNLMLSRSSALFEDITEALDYLTQQLQVFK